MDCSWGLPSSLAVNEWGGKGLAPRKQGLPGLAYYVIEVAHKEELLTTAQRAQEVDAPIKMADIEPVGNHRPRRNRDPYSFSKVKLGKL